MDHTFSGWRLSLGLLLWLLASGLLLVCSASPHSPVAWGCFVGVALMAGGLTFQRWRNARVMTLLGLVTVSWVVMTQQLERGGGHVHVVRLPDEGTRWVNRMLPERDGTLFSARVMMLAHLLPSVDTRELIPALEDGYLRMETAEGRTATPAIATWLAMQRPQAFDAVVVDAATPAPTTALIFLHGWTGNFTLQCWQLSLAARAISALTVCPSVGPVGDWWSAAGEQTLVATVQYLKQRGIQQFYLAGYSNGGVGVGTHAAKFSKQGLLGTVFISGVAPRAQLPAVPGLVIQGNRDSMMSPHAAREFARRWSPQVEFVAVDSGHFALLDRHEAVTAAIVDWLRRTAPRGAHDR